MEEGIKKIKDTIEFLGKSDFVRIVAATKMVDAGRINRLKDYGITDAGENKVQELLQKFDHVSGINWHFIGVLQRNKVKYIVDKVCLIHSVDSLPLALEIDKRAAKIAKIQDILVEVNIGCEETKSGVATNDLFNLLDQIKELKNIRLSGLMTVMPPLASQALYQNMQDLFQKTKEIYGENIKYLSVGMSNDYELAIKHGANLIRPGSAIFGKRAYNTNQ